MNALEIASMGVLGSPIAKASLGFILRKSKTVYRGVRLATSGFFGYWGV